jgi:two-component system sensor histidine kinase RpfC
MYALRNLVTAVKSFRRRFEGRLDSEHEQAFVRLIFGIGLFLYFLYYVLFTDLSEKNENASFVVWVTVGFILVSIGIITHIAAYPQISPPRRLLAATLDSGTVTYFFFHAAEHALPLYFIYLWIIFGYGLRYGRRYLLFILALSLIGFGTAILTLPYWNENAFLGKGLWAGMLVVSLYVNKLVGRLTAALQHAEAANQAKRSFISSISHELRTPLNAIIGMADLLRSTELNAEQEDMVHSMDNASHVMLSLIEDVLDFSKIEAGKLVIENTEFDLHRLINNIVDIFKYQANSRGLQLMAKVQPDVPFALRGDPHHLRQVLVNLLSNAVKFTEKGSVILRIETISDADQAVRLRFSVEDTGIGISVEAQGKVFESFTQADDSTTRRYGGTGLGTTISKQLVELMGGKLGLHSTLGSGSTFWFELNLQKQTGICELQKFTGLRTLLVGFDDEEACAISVMLDSWGVPNQMASNLNSAFEALEKAAKTGTPFQIALLDGWRVRVAKQENDSSTGFFQRTAFALKGMGGNSALSVILCGASITTEKGGRQLIEEAGLSALLDVPVDRRLLFNALHAVHSSQVAPLPSDELSINYSQINQGRPGKYKQYSVLVAEDNLINQKVISKILERAGHRCTLANNGEEALDKLDQQEFDVIVLDMNMPLMTGIDAAKAYGFMRPNPEERAPMIMFSADVTKEAKQEALDAGIDEFLSKPIQVTQFLETLHRLVEQSRSGYRMREEVAINLNSLAIVPAQNEELILNYETLDELDSIGQERMFVDGLIKSFMQDNQILIGKLEESLMAQHFEEFKDILHAMKGAALSIGAVSFRTVCQRMEKMTHSELKRDTKEVIAIMHAAFRQLCGALDLYRIQRGENSSLLNFDKRF